MIATDLLRDQLESSKLLTATLLADMQDAPLTSPTPQALNHRGQVADARRTLGRKPLMA